MREMKTSSSMPATLEDSSSTTPARRRTNASSSVDKLYQKKTPIEHVLLRPGMYVGSTNRVTERKFVVGKLDDFLSAERAGKARLKYEDVEYIPALVKIFDEVLVNACDNYVRDPVKTRRIDVGFDSASREFTVRNDGKGIPVQVHKKENMYIPEMVLGHLLTGSNFAENSDTGALISFFSKKKTKKDGLLTRAMFNKAGGTDMVQSCATFFPLDSRWRRWIPPPV